MRLPTPVYECACGEEHCKASELFLHPGHGSSYEGFYCAFCFENVEEDRFTDTAALFREEMMADLMDEGVCEEAAQDAAEGAFPFEWLTAGKDVCLETFLEKEKSE